MYAQAVYRSNFRSYILRRVLIAVVVFFIVSMFIFYIFHYDDSPSGFLLNPNVSKVELEKIYEQFGIDTSPLVVKYFKWMGDFFTGDWGESIMPASYYK
jgi:peptide/nickel transport system permease protein